MTKDLQFIIETVKQASEMITEDFKVRAKGEKGDLVTNFDFEIEKFIIDKIKQKYSDFGIVSEEYNKDATLQENCFTIDPIDGTINFAHNIPLWAIQVGLIKGGKTCAAVIYLPKFNELYSADETGAYLNGEKIKVNEKLKPSQCVYVIEGKNRTAAIDRMSQYHAHARWIGSAAVDYSWVADGRLGGTIFRNNSAWDYVPGMYICKQAGAYIYDEPESHIAACNKEFADLLKQEATFRKTDNEEHFSF
ncbi:MAG: inositol monophosphatase [Clostridia bacterium]|nr:inositol monophosphatase [Clostridia bacterium]